MTGAIKSLGALGVVVVTYINHTLSPLFWVLLVLAGLDILLNMRDEQKQFQKLGSMFVALGLPTYLSTNQMGVLHMNSEVLKIVVAVLTIGYLQVVFPQVVALLAKIKFSSKASVNTAEHAAIDALAAKVEAQLLARAEAAQKTSTALAATPGSTSDVTRA